MSPSTIMAYILMVFLIAYLVTAIVLVFMTSNVWFGVSLVVLVLFVPTMVFLEERGM